MAGKQAKILSDEDVALILKALGRHRYSIRDQLLFLLSVKAGLRAGEIAALTWQMVLTASGEIGDKIELHDSAAKKRSGRTIPLNSALYDALNVWARHSNTDGHVITSERGRAMRASSVVNWFAELYRSLGLSGCSSHSGRRTFITKAARHIFQAGGSLRDVQQLAGHRTISVTQLYIEGDAPAKRRVVQLI